MTAELQREVEVPLTAPAVTGTSDPVVVGEGRRARRLTEEQAPPKPRRGAMPTLRVRDEKPTPPTRRSRRRVSPGWAYARSILSGVAFLALGFVLLLVVGSPLQAARDQRVLYNDFRKELANATAPVGPTYTDEDGNLHLVQNGDPVAVLSIPRLGADLVVVEGTASGDTMSGPGHRRDTVLPGQAGVSILLGRQSAFGGYFGSIGDLLPGDEITTTTGQGFATYQVDDVRRAGDPQPEPLAAGKARLTLVGAEGTPYLAEDVVRVDATLVTSSDDGETKDKAPFPSVARLVGPSQLPESERPMAVDTSQTFALVLWAQLFLLVVVAFTYARERWGRWQAWAVGVPLLLATGWAVTNQIVHLLPNLL